MTKRLYAMVMAVGMAGSSLAMAEVPFPDALKDANVTLTSIGNGQSESLMLGNGDLYGIVWEKDGGLYHAGDQERHLGRPGRYIARTGRCRRWTSAPARSPGRPALRPATNSPTRTRAAPRHCGSGRPGRKAGCGGLASAAPRNTGSCPPPTVPSATMQVGGARGASTGYKVTLPEATQASAVQLRLRGSANASYYVNVYDKDNRNILATGWKPSPAEATEIDLPIKPQPVRHVEVYTMTSDGKTAENHVESLRLDARRR